MTMLPITHMKGESAGFLAMVNCIVSNLVRQFRPADIFVIRTDSWFDHKWLGFSGKILGVVGVSNQRLTSPPFVPNRVISQEVYSLDKQTSRYKLVQVPPLHLTQPSKENLNRFIDQVTNSGLFIWFSGDPESSSVGSIMVYAIADGSRSAWYASFKKKIDWQVNKVSGLSKSELLHLSSGPLTSIPR
jgi:hypothetical protein